MGEGKEICVERGMEVWWRWGRKDSIDSRIVAIFVVASPQNMLVTQEPLWTADVKCDKQQ